MEMEISDTEPYVSCTDRIHVDRTNSINVLAVGFHEESNTSADLIDLQVSVVLSCGDSIVQQR